MENTRYLMHFGRRELAIAGKLLRLFRSPDDRTLRLGDTITPEFNRDSGMVFLIDDDFNVAVECDGHLEDWLVCPQCGNEAVAKEFDRTRPCCDSFFKSEFPEK